MPDAQNWHTLRRLISRLAHHDGSPSSHGRQLITVMTGTQRALSHSCRHRNVPSVSACSMKGLIYTGQVCLDVQHLNSPRDAARKTQNQSSHATVASGSRSEVTLPQSCHDDHFLPFIITLSTLTVGLYCSRRISTTVNSGQLALQLPIPFVGLHEHSQWQNIL